MWSPHPHTYTYDHTHIVHHILWACLQSKRSHLWFSFLHLHRDTPRMEGTHTHQHTHARTHTNTNTGILNYHCILFLSDPIIAQPQNNYIQWMHSKTQMKCNKRSEALSARLSGLQNGSLRNAFKHSAAPSTHKRWTESEDCILKLRRLVSPTLREALISHNTAVWFSSCDSSLDFRRFCLWWNSVKRHNVFVSH